MLNRYFELLPFIDADDDDIADSLPAPAAKRRLRGLLGELKDVESVSKALQGDHVTLLDARMWFDSLIAARASYARYLAPRAAIVQRPHFEAACVRVLKGQTERLTSAEKASLAPFLAPSPSDDASDDEEQEETSSFVERIQKRRRLEERHAVYAILSTIPPTSNVVERFFSIARTTFGLQRHSLQPYSLEMLLFLRYMYSLEMLLFLRQNNSYWDSRTVDSIE
uniref:HAT C-terminal dimerisation domain-containing protein n=1 Tax=Phytophthora ramorum TaxID=164328 RepID=H3GLY5_PHYRM